ncbi:MAG: hypothetical protein GY716_05505 [bacterium]|nr:hypothetical protein [bacterium]
MSRWASIMQRIALCLLIAGTSGAVHAEIAVDPPGNDPVSTLILGTIVDSPDPIGSAMWKVFRPLPPGQILNPGGYAREDGRPDLFWKENSWPVVVWSYNLGADHDIAISEWDGTAWTFTEFITSGAVDELDPRVFVDVDGTVHVAWWVAGVEKVYVATRPAGTTIWDPPVLVTAGAETGRRPSILVFAGEVKVAYERTSSVGGMAQDVVVASEVGGSFVLELAGSTVRTDPLDAMLHAEDGHLWLDWKHESSEFGCAEYVGTSWTAIAPEPWTDPTWVGVEEVRKTIRNEVVGP